MQASSRSAPRSAKCVINTLGYRIFKIEHKFLKTHHGSNSWIMLSKRITENNLLENPRNQATISTKTTISLLEPSLKDWASIAIILDASLLEPHSRTKNTCCFLEGKPPIFKRTINTTSCHRPLPVLHEPW